MGGTGHVLVLGRDAVRLLAYARGRLDALERAWSRFLPGSDVSRLNAAGGRAVGVGPDTVALLRTARRYWQLTDGQFDPTVHAAMLAHGYDRDLAAVRAAGAPAPAAARPAPGCAGLEVDAAGRARLPAGVGFDPGGIGKGLAADLVAAELLARGAAGALVNVGGDLRAAGRAPGPYGWVVTVPDPYDAGRERARLALDDAGVATSSTLRRRWTAGGREVHHVLDPATGRPTGEELVAVTVVAGSAAWAEAVTKAVLVSGDAGAARAWPGVHLVAAA
jgi:FAD:protein FMN transferase